MLKHPSCPAVPRSVTHGHSAPPPAGRLLHPLLALRLFTDEEPRFHEPVEPSGEEVRGDTLLRICEHFAEVPSVAECDVAQIAQEPIRLRQSERLWDGLESLEGRLT